MLVKVQTQYYYCGFVCLHMHDTHVIITCAYMAGDAATYGVYMIIFYTVFVFLLECTNRFVRVSYDPTATTISCTFENRLDSSIKSCDIKYGTCGQEMYTTQGNTTVESPFMVRLKLNSNILNSMSCYIVTASNETLTLMVKGEFITQSNNDSVNTSILAGTVIGVIIIIMLGLVVVTVIILILVLSYKRKLLGK